MPRCGQGGSCCFGPKGCDRSDGDNENEGDLDVRTDWGQAMGWKRKRHQIVL